MTERLQTHTALELIETPLPGNEWVVEDLIPVGLTVLAGSPKVGKSWFCESLALNVAAGDPFLEHATSKAGVLYLALEDTPARIQKRLFHLTDEANDNLFFATSAENIKTGLIDQMDFFVTEHPETKLVIIDTLQTVRAASHMNAYQSDYDDLRLLKLFADEKNLAVLAIHHTRKLADDSNVFNSINGSNGIMGVADTTMILAKTGAFENKAVLSITGRDVNLAEYKVGFVDCRWHLIEKTSQEELEERDVPPEILSVLDFMAGRAQRTWEGTSSQLIEEAGISDVIAPVLTKRLNEHHEFMEDRGVTYSRKRTGSSRFIMLAKADSTTASIDPDAR